jgi:hypothetical protein
MKTINNITLYDLMSEDLDIWISKDKVFGFNIEIDDENGDPLMEEENVHSYAADAFADFCKRYLHSYEKATNREAA